MSIVVRKSWDDYGISMERYQELKSICHMGEYKPLVRSVAYITDRNIAEFIVLSVTRKRSYDYLEFDTELGRVPCGRTDFYAIRRKFYSLLDAKLRKGAGVAYRQTADLQETSEKLNIKRGGYNMKFLTLKAMQNDNSQYAISLASILKNEDGEYSAVIAIKDKRRSRAKNPVSDMRITGRDKDTVIEQVKQLADMYPPVKEDVLFIDLTED